MRQTVVLGILVVLFLVFGGFVAYRGGVAQDDSVDAEAESAAAVDADAPDEIDEAEFALPEEDEEVVAPENLDRPLRIIGTSLELMAPGLVANGGDKPSEDSLFTEAGLDVEFVGTGSLDEIRRAIAQGGDDENGADIAIIALPGFVASYEQLRALEPRVFFVAGWSRGRETLASSHAGGLTNINDLSDITLRGAEGDSATFFSLYLMNLAGASLDKITLVDEIPDGQDGFSAVSRGHADLFEMPDGHNALITTADAQGLITYVAIASEGFIRRHTEELTTWAQIWQKGRAQISDDVPAAARQLSSLDDNLDALDMIDLLGAIELASPRDNARMAALSGRTPLTLEKQFQLAWDVWRNIGALSIPRPRAMPIGTDIIINLVRSDEDDHETLPTSTTGEPSTERVLLEHHHTGSHHDQEEMLDKVGTLAGVFNHSAIRIALGDHTELTEELIELVAERYEITPQRLLVGERRHRDDTAYIEIYAVE